MLGSFLHTNNSVIGLIARISLGIVILPHGLQKLLGTFGGLGFTASMDSFVNSGLPSAVAILIIVGESFGALGLILGFFSRLAALGIVLIMTGAILMVHIQNGFFMNWFNNKPGEGFEFHLLAIGLGLIVLIQGGGMWSLDRKIMS